jgi:hypothetical protein
MQVYSAFAAERNQAAFRPESDGVARIERSEMRENFAATVPDFATLNPGYHSCKPYGASSTWRQAAGRSAIFSGGLGFVGTGEGFGCSTASVNQ